jgi:hypothetical protein
MAAAFGRVLSVSVLHFTQVAYTKFHTTSKSFSYECESRLECICSFRELNDILANQG